MHPVGMCFQSCHFLTEISMSHSEKKKHDWKVPIEIKYLHTIGTWHLPELYILLKLKCSHSQFYRLHLIVKCDVSTDCVQWLVQYILATWFCLPQWFSSMPHHEAAKLTLKADRPFHTSVKSYSKLLWEDLFWHLKCHPTVQTKRSTIL